MSHTDEYPVKENESALRRFYKKFLRVINGEDQHSHEYEEIDEHEEYIDPIERQKRINQMTGWIEAGCLITIAVFAIGVGLIYLSDLLIPLVLARFSVYLYQPFINYMVGKKAITPNNIRLRLPRFLAVLVCCIATLVVVAILGVAIYYSVQSILQDYDAYETRFREIYDMILDFLEENGFTRDQIDDFIPSLSLGTLIPEFLGEASSFLEEGILYLLFLVYMLLEYDEKQEKVEIQRKIDQKIRKYIFLKIVVSLLTAVLVGLNLWLLNIDMWVLWALLTFLLNFIPNVGSVVACLIPIPVIVLDPSQTWWSICLAIFGPIAIQLVIGNFIEPLVTGKSMKLSAVAVLVGLAFWGGVWGIVGAFLSVPLTVILHIWLLSYDHPMAQFLGKAIAGEIEVFEHSERIIAQQKGEKEN